jgi:hypothetical protein
MGTTTVQTHAAHTHTHAHITRKLHTHTHTHTQHATHTHMHNTHTRCTHTEHTLVQTHNTCRTQLLNRSTHIQRQSGLHKPVQMQKRHKSKHPSVIQQRVDLPETTKQLAIASTYVVLTLKSFCNQLLTSVKLFFPCSSETVFRKLNLRTKNQLPEDDETELAKIELFIVH